MKVGDGPYTIEFRVTPLEGYIIRLRLAVFNHEVTNCASKFRFLFLITAGNLFQSS